MSTKSSGKKKKKKSSGGKKSGARKSTTSSAEVRETRCAQTTEAPEKERKKEAPGTDRFAQEAGNASGEEIPVGAQAPEEMELTADDLSSLFGTQDMPELPDSEMAVDVQPRMETAGDKTKEVAQVPREEKAGKSAEPQAAPAEAEPPAPKEAPQPSAEKVKTAEHAGEPDDEAGEEEEEDSSAEAPLEFLSFMLGEEEYALPLTRISEIIKPRSITDVPRCKGFVLGIISLRGVIIPVFDLLTKLNLGKVTWNRSARIVIVHRNDGDLVGLATDSVEDVVRVLPGDIEPPPPAMGGVEAQYLEGVGRAEESRRTRVYAEESGKEEDGQEKKAAKKKLVILLNLDKVAAL